MEEKTNKIGENYNNNQLLFLPSEPQINNDSPSRVSARRRACASVSPINRLSIIAALPAHNEIVKCFWVSRSLRLCTASIPVFVNVHALIGQLASAQLHSSLLWNSGLWISSWILLLFLLVRGRWMARARLHSLQGSANSVQNTETQYCLM